MDGHSVNETSAPSVTASNSLGEDDCAEFRTRSRAISNGGSSCPRIPPPHPAAVCRIDPGRQQCHRPFSSNRWKRGLDPLGKSVVGARNTRCDTPTTPLPSACPSYASFWAGCATVVIHWGPLNRARSFALTGGCYQLLLWSMETHPLQHALRHILHGRPRRTGRSLLSWFDAPSTPRGLGVFLTCFFPAFSEAYHECTGGYGGMCAGSWAHSS